MRRAGPCGRSKDSAGYSMCTELMVSRFETQQVIAHSFGGALNPASSE